MPRAPLPANDNFPGRLPKAPSGIPPRIFRRLAGRMLLRGIPIVGWAWTAWELYNLYKDWQAGRYMRPPVGYTKVAEYDIVYDAILSSPDDEWGGFVAWTWQDYLPGYPRTWYPTAPDIVRAPHFWWAEQVPGNPAHAPIYGVKERWEWNWTVGDDYALPPKPIFIPYIHPIDIPGVPSLPLAPMPVPLPRPVRLPGVVLPPDVHNPDADGYDDPGLKYRRRPRKETSNLPDEEPVQARRPKRREKERKVTGSNKHLKFLGWILSQYSELGDLVDAFNDALPDQYKSDGTLKDKLKNLYQHWDKVSMDQAVQNMVENMVTDPKFAGVFEEMQERQEEFGLDLGGLKGLEGSSGIWPTIR